MKFSDLMSRLYGGRVVLLLFLATDKDERTAAVPPVLSDFLQCQLSERDTSIQLERPRPDRG